MKHTYIFLHDGVYIDGCSVVRAPTEQSARNRLRILLKPKGLSPSDAEVVWCSRSPRTNEDKVIFYGDY